MRRNLIHFWINDYEANELMALVLKHEKDNFQNPVSEKISYYKNRLLYWQDNTDKLGLDWAEFLLDDTRPNKEKLLSVKRKEKST